MQTGALIRSAAALSSVAAVLAACSSGRSADPPANVTSPAPPDSLRLTDVAGDVGLAFEHGAFRWGPSPDPIAMMGAGVCWLDYDGDGWLDLFVVNSYAQIEAARWREEGGLPRSALFRNVDGEFTDVSRSAGADVVARGNGCVAADLDLDGHTDLYVTTSSNSLLLWNNGDGTFSEGAREAGVAAPGWRTGSAAGDIDGDGWPDLFVAGYTDLNSPNPDGGMGFPSTWLPVRDLLYLSDGPADDGRVTFREVGQEAGLEPGGFTYGLGALLSDLDRDGDLDLYVANDTDPNSLYDNVPWPGGAGADPAGLGFRLEERAAPAGVADAGAGMGVAGGDFDGDGRTDLVVTNLRGQVHGVFRSQTSDEDRASFADVSETVGPDLGAFTGWGVSWGDLDLDTDLDLVVVNGQVPLTDLVEDAQPLQVFENRTAQGAFEQFADASETLGLAEIGPLNSRGSAAADFDNDGDLDVAVGSVGGRLVLLRNDGAVGNWLEVELGGFHPGATVTVTLPDGRELVRESRAGGSYLSSEDPRLHFGLGAAGEVSELEVRWPGGEITRLDAVAANQLVAVAAPRES